MSIRTYLFVAGGLMVVIGFIGLGMNIIILTDDIVGESVCGSGFSGLSRVGSGGRSSEWLDKCEAAMSARRMWAWPLLGVGLLVAMAGFIERGKGKAGEGTPRTA